MNKQNKTVSILILITNCFCWEKEKGLIYILLWSPIHKEPFNYLGLGQNAFVKRNCTFQNCFITNNRTYFNSVLEFDVLLYNVYYFKFGLNNMPDERADYQEYVLAGVEPASYYPVCPEYSNLFNITWTYKLSSDVVYPYIYVKNRVGDVIGPSKNMNWKALEDMEPPEKDVIQAIQSKNIAAAWIVSNCYTKSDRKPFVDLLQLELAKYGHKVDVYGDCGDLECPRGTKEKECFEKIERDYYFYLAFENSYCEDYVTEKILHGLNHYAVPIVLGGANYTRFMPEGAYLDAGKLGVKNLAFEMNNIINNPAKYLDFFKWRRYYTYHSVTEDDYRDTVCAFCALLNNNTRRNQRVFYKNLTRWWNEWGVHKVYPTRVPAYYVPPEEPTTAAVLDVLSNIYNYFFPDS